MREPEMKSTKYAILFALVVCFLAIMAFTAETQAKKPNIVVIWGDDIGESNISAYSTWG